MNKVFKAKYEVADWYVGKSRPLYFSITTEDIEDDMDDVDLRELYSTMMQEHFEENIWPEGSDIEAFVEWANSQEKA